MYKYICNFRLSFSINLAHVFRFHLHFTLYKNVPKCFNSVILFQLIILLDAIFSFLYSDILSKNLSVLPLCLYILVVWLMKE
jgi:hypothetical protein